MNAIATLVLLAGTLAPLEPVDPSVHPDSFVTVSCLAPRQCLVLDDAGNLFYTSDSGKRLQARSRLRMYLRKIRFTGLLDGFGLDNNGGLWRSRNGGRTFEPTSVPEQSPLIDLAVGPGRAFWILARSGTLYRWSGREWIRTGSAAKGEPVALAGGAALLGVVTDDGQVATSPDGKAWSLANVLPPGKATGVAIGEQGQVAAFGCGGEVRFSLDRGGTWKNLSLPESAALKSGCPRQGWVLADGRILLLGWPRILGIGDPRDGTMKSMDTPYDRNWLDGSRDGDGFLLVGEGGAMARLEGANGALTVKGLASCRTGITDVRLLADRRQAFRSFLDGAVESSTDLGNTWNPLTLPGTEAVRLSAVDEKHLFALVGTRTIAGSGDGGKTWSKLGEWADPALSDLFFADRDRGWAVGQQGAVVRTTDGGKNWTLDRLPTDNETLQRLQFVDAKRGWAVGGHQSVFGTRDGGQTWEKLRSGRGQLLALFFLPSGEGWVAGDYGTLLHTPDGGKSWTPQVLPNKDSIRAVWFIDAQRGLLAGASNQILLTTDGGQTWRAAELSTHAGVEVVACWKSGLCLLGGERGLFLSGAPFGLRR